MKKRNLSACLAALLLIPLMSIGQWQADMTNSMQGDVRNYKVHSNGMQYRYDFSDDGMTGVVIVNPAENLTAIMLVDKKMVHFTPCDGMMSQMNDPVQAYSSYLVYGAEKAEGNEEINGYDCVKTGVYMDEKPLVTRWFSKELNFPVKIENHYTENTYMLLENVETWKPDASMFMVPEDYLEVDEEMRPAVPEPEPPTDWMEKEVAVPVDIKASRGMAISVPIVETVYHKLIIENTGDTHAKFSYHSFVDGKELSEDIQGPEEYRTIRLYMGEDYKMTMNWKAGQLILFKFYEGEATLKVFKE